jgi:pyruvate dehydrogenase E2 component (dihydrolipoamide acetyltransferase)
MLLTEVVMPQFSLSMQVGTVIDWFKKEGDPVQKGDALCEIEGDKATFVIEAPASGILRKVVATKGEEFGVRQVMAYIGDAADQLPEERAASTQTTATQAPAERPAAQAPAAVARATPVAKRLAAELGVDLQLVIGTGPDGLIGKEDVLKAKEAAASPVAAPAAEPPASGGVDTALDVESSQPVTGIRKLVGERMLSSYQQVPHIHLTVRPVVTKAMALRRAYNAGAGADRAHLTITDLLLWSAGRALAQRKLFNSSFHEGNIQLYRQINLGLAIDTERGLIVGVVPAADGMTIQQLARRRIDVVEKVMAGRQTQADTSGATFTITNLGMLGVLSFDPIVPPGNAAILGVGKVTREVLVDENGRMGVEETVLLTLACDHRVADGADAARFLADIVGYLEEPDPIFAA